MNGNTVVATAVPAYSLMIFTYQCIPCGQRAPGQLKMCSIGVVNKHVRSIVLMGRIKPFEANKKPVVFVVLTTHSDAIAFLVPTTNGQYRQKIT